jgi:phosphoglycerol transferase MdoB-like AlkP superfamily enzyme
LNDETNDWPLVRNIHINFLFQFFSWLVFFQIARLAFVIWNAKAMVELPFGELAALPLKSVYLDMAMASYFMAIPYLFFATAIWIERQWPLRLNWGVTAILLTITSIITIAELPIYDEWKTKLNFKAVGFLGTPSEVVRTATTEQLVGGMMAIALLSWVGLWTFKKMGLQQEVPLCRKPYWQALLFTLLTPCLIAVGLRGGLQEVPIQVSDAYYSKHDVLNLAATNSVFHLMSSCIHGKDAGQPYQLMPDADAKALFDKMARPEQDSTTRIFSIEKPNIVLVILESWTADVVAACGGFPGLTPNFDRLARAGALFTNCHASGLRSDEGMAAILSAFPAQPKTTIIRMPNKYRHLPCIKNELAAAGYASSFLFGGQLSYGNIRSYLYFNGFDRIVEGKDFSASIPRCKLGVADGYLFERQLAELAEERQPFFAAMFTLSSHSPFDVPMEPVVDWGGKDKGFLNSIAYADRCLGDFMEQAQKTDWYENTVFVFTADHSRPSPKDWHPRQPESRRIPLLFYGEPVKAAFRGTTDTLPASQTDLAATLLAQLGLPTAAYKYSNNLFNPLGPRHAFYSLDEGCCIVKKEGQVCWHKEDGHTDFVKPGDTYITRHIKKEGKAYLQEVVGDYFAF